MGHGDFRATAKLHKLVRSGHRFYSGKQEAVSIANSAPENALEWFRRQPLTFDEGTSLGEIEKLKPLIPETLALAQKALILFLQSEAQISGLLAAIKKAKQDISRQMETLFMPIEHPPIR